MFDPNRFTPLKPKADNVNQPVSAVDINIMQKLLEQNQRLLFQIRDEDFKQNCQLVLEHHPAVNTLWMDLFKNTNGLDLYASQDVVFDENERAVMFAPDSTSLIGVVYSKPYTNPSRLPINELILLTQYYTPQGTSIKFQVSNNGGQDFVDINPFRQNPLERIDTSGHTLVIRAELTRDNVEVTPRIENWAILWWDATVGVITLPDGTVQIPEPGEGDVGWDDDPPSSGDIGGGGDIVLGAKYHRELLGIGPDDHHPKDHRHGQDGVSYVNLATDVVGILGSEHIPVDLGGTAPVLGNTWLIREGDRPIGIDAPTAEVKFITFEESPEGAWEDLTGRMQAVVSINKEGTQVTVTGLLYENAITPEGKQTTRFAGVVTDVIGYTDDLIDVVKRNYGGMK